MKILSDHGFHTSNKVYLIAEIGINHNGDLEVAKKMVDSAENVGAKINIC